MGKDALLKILQTLLKTDAPFGFLLDLKREDLEKLVVAVRDRVEGCNKDQRNLKYSHDGYRETNPLQMRGNGTT